MTSPLPMTSAEFRAVENEILLYPEGVPLRPETVLALLGEARRARANEKQLIARVRAMEIPDMRSGI